MLDPTERLIMAFPVDIAEFGEPGVFGVSQGEALHRGATHEQK